MPRLTVAGLLLVTLAVAVGFSVSVVPASNNGNGFLAIYIADRRWLQGLQATGGILLCYELLIQARSLWRRRASSDSNERLSIWLAATVRFLLAIIIGMSLLVRLLINRQVIAQAKNADLLQVWTILWPDFLLVVASLVAIRLMLVSRPKERNAIVKKSPWRYFTIQALVVLGASIIAMYIIIDRLTVSVLVHIAMDGVEKSQALWKQRHGTYPNHLIENYWSFRCSVSALVAVIAAGGVLFNDAHMSATKQRIGKRALFLVLLLCISGFLGWFASSEFPRMSPDLASVGSARSWSDTVVGLMLWLGIGIWMGIFLTKRRTQNTVLSVKPPAYSSFGVLAAAMIAIAQSWSLVETFRELLSFTPLFGTQTIRDILETLANLLVWPEMLVPFVLLISSLAFLWQAYRGRTEPRPLPSIRATDLAWYTFASLALLAVAVPTFAAFGFCFWLGPFV